MAITLESIRAARQRIAPAIYHSPCPFSLSLSRLCRCEIFCKMDHLQMTGSFKERGALNKLLLLREENGDAVSGVIAASAGNHALGLAYHGQRLGVAVTVVMPRWAPLVKVSNCRSFGANVIIHGETFDEAQARATEIAVTQKLVYVPGFDDDAIIAGQGTLGLELLEDVPDLDAVLVPVGGGGLIAGLALAVKSQRPKVRVIGVESRQAPTLHDSLASGHVKRVSTLPTLADGLAVAQAGQRCFALAKEWVERIVLIEEPAIATAILRLLELEKTVVEGAGAVGLAAAMAGGLQLEGKKVVLVLSGGNIDVTVISRIIERGLAADGRLCRIVAQLSDRPGTLAHLLGVLAQTGASVKEVAHDRHFGPEDVAKVRVSIIMETRDFAHIAEIETALAAAGIQFQAEN